MKKQWKTIVLWVGIGEAVGGLSGLLSMEATKFYQQAMEKPPLSPPGWVFGIVWGILFALMGFGAGLIALEPASTQRSRGLNLWVVQLVVNFFWPLLFFNAQAWGFALVWLLVLWALVLWMILVFRKTVPLAAWLQIPYLLWLSFAVYLNAGVWLLNR